MSIKAASKNVSPDLLPCPFCGGDATVSQYGTTRKSTQYECTNCGCFLETGETFNYGDSWNRREFKTSPAQNAVNQVAFEIREQGATIDRLLRLDEALEKLTAESG